MVHERELRSPKAGLQRVSNFQLVSKGRWFCGLCSLTSHFVVVVPQGHTLLTELQN